METGGCPHAAIREDISTNIEVSQHQSSSSRYEVAPLYLFQAARRLTKLHQPHILLIESGGDNLAANFSRELADYIIYVIDVAGMYAS